MPDGIGHGAHSASAYSTAISQNQKVAEQVEQLNARKEKAVAEIVQRQADFSTNRAEDLVQRAEKAQERVETRETQNGLGASLDISV